MKQRKIKASGLQLKLILLLGVVIFSVSTGLRAETLLYLADNFNLHALNGSRVTVQHMTREGAIKLSPGLNLLAIQFQQKFNSNPVKRQQVVYSKVYLLRVYLQKDSRYRQLSINSANFEAAQRYSQNPIFEIILLNNKNTKTQTINFEINPILSRDIHFIINKTRPKAKPLIRL